MGLLDRLKKPKPAGPQVKKWVTRPEDMPWFDQANAEQVLEKRRAERNYTDREFEMLRQWVRDGYHVVDNVVDMKLIDGMVQDIENLWTTSDGIPGLVLHDLRLTDGPEVTHNVPHVDLVKHSAEQRQEIKKRSHWRCSEFFKYSKNCAEIRLNPELERLISLIMDRPTPPEYTVNFMWGSRQALHQDGAVFHLHPPNYLCGVWLACEDISPDSGPLVYYPGSHRSQFFPKFDNYPQTNLHCCPKEQMQEYADFMEQQAKNYERHQFVAKKGQVLLWHAMLIHGGDTVRRPELTRHSYVCHYVPPGMKKDDEVVGPFNW
ncbi:MAG: phytanoyl-CoA dioxygenase family protein [Candidatus Sumerlaeaceae bacterium]|nr:phytanoyl-CoA dioxygenase family protein [Candidatus Sumerlaeaceae bacterium]